MSEHRLIDANVLLQYMSDMEVQTGKKCCTQAVKSCIEEFFPQVVFEQPTIDPETLPVVRELREKLMLTEANQNHFKEERDLFLFKMKETAEAATSEIDRRNETICELREKLERVTDERDSYKIFFNDVTACGDCNDCWFLKTCKYKPRVGETTRFNCPLWSKQTSIPRDQWQDAAEVME